ncbi:MAG: hypothetical protein ABIG85_06730 [Chloroflexota bacterium]
MERATQEEYTAPPRRLRARWLGRIAYRDAWAMQQALAAARAAGTLDEDQLLLLEHDAVLTLGRNASEAHVLALPGLLAERNIEVLRVERGGEVTYHGPGQLVAYPIVALATLGASVTPGTATTRDAAATPDAAPAPAGMTPDTARPIGIRRFVEALEGAMADTCAAAGVAAGPRSGHPGCWVGAETPLPRKIGAVGIRVARGVSFHGIALNVTTNLADFDLIDPCGTPGLRSTSIARERARAGIPGADADAGPSTESVVEAAAAFADALAGRLGFELAGDLSAAGDPEPAGELAGVLR